MVTVDVLTFIGRMVQHVLPKGFQHIRYYGLQATKTLKKWIEVIKKGLLLAGRVIRGVYEVVAGKRYRERYKEMGGHEMYLWKVWHSKYGTIYDEWENLKAGKYEPVVNDKNTRERHSFRSSAGGIQLPLFPVPV